MMMSDARQARIRQALSSSMSSLMNEDISVNSSSGHLEFSAPVEFCKENIDALLSMKMKGKTKFDHKGKCEQMAEYIKKLRACIRWFQELEESYVAEKEQLVKDLITEKTERKETEDGMKKREEEMQTTIAKFTETCFSLQEKLSKSECEREASVQAWQKDLEARKVAEKALACASAERDKAQQEAFCLSQQVTSLQDINKRSQEYNTSLQQYNSKLQSDAASAAETVSQLQKEKSTMMETHSSLRGHTAALQDQYSVTKVALQEAQKERKEFQEEVERLRGQLQRTTDDRDHYATQSEILSVEVKKYKECTGKSTAELEQLTNKAAYLEETFSSQSQLISSLQLRLEIANKRAEIAESSDLQQKSQCAEQHQKIEELQSRLSEAETQIFEGELLRRKLHNTILELKGNIRVFCRVRPLLPDDECASESLAVAYPTSTELLGRGIDLIQNTGQKHTFTFDKIFGHESKQGDVFVEISQLVQSALDGYKVCIFAYGQTGSGKTFTMSGPQVITEENWGVNYRALNDLFDISKNRKNVFEYQVGVQMIEIYNEQVRDLLATDGSSRRLEIRNNSQQNGLNVPDANLIPVMSTFDVINLMNIGQKNRVVGATALNDRSSRSHSVLTVHVQGTDLATGSILRGCLHLVDLAGSERVDKSEATGDRLKEAQHINKSLSALGDVISALAQKNSHVPYRNSKLTQLLQDSLGGQAKTLMFVHISPEAESYGETLSTLKFAERVATVELGAARSNRESAEVRELKEQIYNLKVALAKKESEGEQSQSLRSSRNSTERQRMKVGVSPLQLQRQIRDSQAQSNRRQPTEEVGNIEGRSISSGRHRKSIYSRDLTGEEADANYPRLVCRPSPERRSLSAERRSLSADRGNHTRSRIKHDILEEQEARKWQDKVMVNRHLTIHSAASRNDAMREACELAKQDSISDMFYQKYYANPRKIYPEREDVQLLMEQNEAHIGIKRNKLEVKGKQETQVRRTPPGTTDESDIDVYRTSDCSETDLWQFKELNLSDIATIQHVPRIRKIPQTSTRSSQPVERRSPSQAKSPASASRLYNGNGQSKARSVRQSVASLPSGGMESKRISPGGKFAFEGRVASSK